jgi:Tfp pilus assembly protein PilO
MRAYKKYLLTMGVVWAASLGLFVLAFVFLVSPQRKITADLARELAEKNKLCESALEAAREENKKKLLDEVQELKSRLGDYVVEFEESANLTFDISRIAGDKQVSSFTVKTPDQSRNSDQSDSKNLQENRVEVSFNSDYGQFASFLNALERHRPVVFVDKFKLGIDRQGEAGIKVDMDLSFMVKRKPEG